MEMVDSNMEVLACGEPCCTIHSPPPQWTGMSINPKCILHTLVRIMKDAISDFQLKRQLYLLNELRKGLTCGFWIQDIENSTKLIELLQCKSTLLPQFEEFLQFALQMLHYPPLLCRTNEILLHEREVQAYFEFFGYLLVTTPRPSTRETVLKSLQTLLHTKNKVCPWSMPWTMIVEHIGKSNLPLVLTHYAEICMDAVYHDIVQIMVEIASHSSEIRLQLLKYNLLHILMMRLDPKWRDHLNGPRPNYRDFDPPANYPLDDAIMLIHSLLDTYKTHPKTEIPTPSIGALWGLRYVLQVYTVSAMRNERNFVAAIWLLFIECFPQAKLVHSGIVHDFAWLATFGDKTLGGTWTALCKFNLDTIEDFDFKRTCMMAIILCNSCLGADKIYIDAQVTEVTTTLIDMRNKRWGVQFHNNLRVMAMQVLHSIIGGYLHAFLLIDGPTRLMRLQTTLLDMDLTESNYEVYLQCMKLTWKLLRINKEKNVLGVEYVEGQRKIQKAIFLREFAGDLKTKSQKLMSYALLNLIALPSNECAADVELVVHLLERVAEPRPKDIEASQTLLVPAIALLWKHGLHNDVNYLYFIKLKGVYLLLDLIKVSVPPVQLISLGYLADLLDEGTAIPYVITWQNGGVGILTILLSLFRGECREIGVRVLESDIVADTKFPLMGKSQRDEYARANLEASPSLSDMFLSCRPRIHAILRLLDECHGTITEMADDYYKTYNTNLSTEDKITKVLCDNYMMLKMGEVWHEVVTHVGTMHPVPADIYQLDAILEYFNEWGAKVQRLQRKWLAIERKEEHYDEEEFYNLLRETKLGPALEAFAEMKYLARAANPRFRHDTTVDERHSERGIIETHKTLRELNNFFVAYEQKLAIQSDVIVDPFAPIPPKPVSVDGSDDVSMYNETISEVSMDFNIDCKGVKGGKKKPKPAVDADADDRDKKK